MSSHSNDVSTDAIRVAPEGGSLVLLISHGGVVSTHPLEGPGPFVVGRSRSCDVIIDHPSVSRRHVELTLFPLALADLGSVNGTRVRGEPLEPGKRVDFDVGESALIGEVTVLLQRTVGHPVTPTRQARPLEGRLAEECARSARSGAPFCHARLHCVHGRDRERVSEIISATLRSADVVSEAAPGQFQALLVDVGASEARAALERLRLRCVQAGAEVRLGSASYPGEGTAAETLSALAWERVTAPPDRPPTAMDRVRELIAQVAPATISVLVRGETGTGKELCAEMLHRLSPRAQKPLVRINCAAFSEALLESELFGHEKGAFTGAHAAKIGLIEAADGGTLFLDEIGELSPGMQSKLLRVLESRELRRVGGLDTRSVDVRFVAATHRALQDDIAAGRFRQDLYFRLSGVTVVLPPLRQRPEAIEGLARAFVTRACQVSGRPPLDFTGEALATLAEHPWPGNVRELRHAVERAMLFAGEGPIDVRHLGLVLDGEEDSLPTIAPEVASRLRPDRSAAVTIPPGIRPPQPVSAPRAPAAPAAPEPPAASAGNLHDEVARLEKERILQALTACGGNQTRAARLLGIARGTLQTRMDAFGIPRPRKP